MKLILTIALVSVLAACGKKEELYGDGVPQATSAPTVVQQPAHQDNTATNMLLGGALGYMLGSSTNKQVAPPTPTIVTERTVIREVPTKAPPPAAKVVPVPVPIAAPKPVTPAPAPAKPTPSFSQPTQAYKYNAPTYTYRPTPSPSPSFKR